MIEQQIQVRSPQHLERFTILTHSSDLGHCFADPFGRAGFNNMLPVAVTCAGFPHELTQEGQAAFAS